MAGGATIGALRVVLGADTAIFDKNLKQAQGRLAAFGKGVGVAMAAVAASVAAAATAVGVAMRGMLTEADKLTKLGRAIGIPVEELSALKHAAELSGLSIDSFGKAMGRFARNMMDAASDMQSTAGRAFAAIGVSVQDAAGNLRSSTDVMADIADRFRSMEDGAGKTALAMQLFGRTGADMINLLNNGSAGIRAMTEEAQQLGIVIDQQTGEAAERFNDALDKLKKAQTGIITQITARFAPTLAGLAESLVNTAKNSEALRYAGDLLVNVLKGLVTAGTIVAGIFRELGRIVAAVAGAVVAAAQLEFKAAADLVKQHFGNMKDAVAADVQFLRELWAGFPAETQAATVTFQEKTSAPIIQSTRAMAEEMRNFQMAAQMALNSVLNSPTETFQAKMAALEQAVRNGTISFAEFGQVVKQVQQENIQHWENLGSTVASTLTSVFGKSKAAAIGSAIINTAVGVTQALRSLPPPFSFATAAAVAAAGAAQIASIRSTSMGGGGSARRPSVSTGSVQQQPQPTAPQQSIFIEGLDPNARFTGDQIRRLIDQVNEAVRNGAQILVRA